MRIRTEFRRISGKKGSIFSLITENLTTSFFVMFFIVLSIFYLNHIFGTTLAYTTYVPEDFMDMVTIRSVEQCLSYNDPVLFRNYPYVDINKFNEDYIKECISYPISILLDYNGNKEELNLIKSNENDEHTVREYTIPVIIYDKERLYQGEMTIGI